MFSEDGSRKIACDGKSVKLLNWRLRGLADFGSCICQAEETETKLVLGFSFTWILCVHLFNVVDLPDEGLPTKPMRGSRGMIDHLHQGEIDRVGTLSYELLIRQALLDKLHGVSVEKCGPLQYFGDWQEIG